MHKIINDSEIFQIKDNGLVLVGGCFDILHPAHLEFFKVAKKQGKYLAVFLESDENIKHLKGVNRPLNNQITRAENLSEISDIDYIILLKMPVSSKYYYDLVKNLSPDIIAVTSGDPLIEVKIHQANMVGGKVVEVIKRDTKHSSTKLIKDK